MTFRGNNESRAKNLWKVTPIMVIGAVMKKIYLAVKKIFREKSN